MSYDIGFYWIVIVIHHKIIIFVAEMLFNNYDKLGYVSIGNIL